MMLSPLYGQSLGTTKVLGGKSGLHRAACRL